MQAAALQLVEDLQPELGAFGLLDPQTQHFLAAVGADTRGELLRRYGRVIVDECHHVSADSFEAVLKTVQARYVLGLTATPVRRDSQQPAMFMLCGPIRLVARLPANAPQRLEVFPQRLTSTVDVAADAPIQAVFAQLAQDTLRTQMAEHESFRQSRAARTGSAPARGAGPAAAGRTAPGQPDGNREAERNYPTEQGQCAAGRRVRRGE
ncbi:DEAD/DEAH box helicase family protein [Burkholderia ubonensis]|uniref:DEAD/DEAH box helicase n=1 Tax=Burkholderia ubonensis TaxID=101571 RepID=UPI001E39C07D|nr:DEAD/DEAH box helicase family protein [Burkholderia ubonensis]